MLNRFIYHRLATGLKRSGFKPRKFHRSRIGKEHIVAISDGEDSSHLIADNVYTGVSPDPYVAASKALCEYIERQAYSEARSEQIKSCQFPGTSGVAAYPITLLADTAQKKAKKNAMAEAVERYVWATWWDNADIGQTIRPFYPCSVESKNLDCLIRQQIDVEQAIKISPMANCEDEIAILFYFTKNGGVFTGGGAGKDSIYRGLAELARHALAYSRYEKTRPESLSFYERRLVFFGSGKGANIVKSRLSSPGNCKIELPALEFDEPVTHKFQHLVAVHRCLFKNQPLFIGGDLERCCL